MTCSIPPTASACPCAAPEFPVEICNPANQPAISFRTGDYLAFRDRLLRPLPQETQLTAWQPGADGDLAVQLAEWWAYLADILTFYNERIANEAYLGTAIQAGSVNHLVQLLGYRPRPALGASVTLAGLLTPGARPPVVLPQGMQVQSKPANGEKPQVFELAAQTLLAAPDIVSGRIVPDNQYLLAQAGAPGSGNTLWLAGTVTGIKPGDHLLVVNAGALNTPPAAGFDYAWINVTGIQPGSDPLGATVTALAFSPLASTLAPGAQAGDYVLLKSRQSTPVWSFPTASTVISDSQVTLAGLVRGLTPNSLFLLDAPAGSNLTPAALLATSYAETIWYANCGAGNEASTAPASPAVAIGIPISTIGFSGPGGDWNAARANITLRYAFAPIGTLVPVLGAADVTFPNGGSTLTPVNPGAGFPDANAPVLLADAAGNATAATLIPASATQAAFAPIPPRPGLSLASPLDILFNPLPFTRGKTVTAEILGSGNPAVAGQDFTLKNAPVTYFADPASISGDGYSSTVQILVNNTVWTEQRSFFGQPANAQIFVLREDDAGQTHVTFGDGANGALLPTGANNVIAYYRYGAGAAAPAAETITVVQTPQPGLKAIRNPLPPTGGSDADSPARLKSLAPQSVLTFNRAVSLDDYAAIARTGSGVNQAQAAYAFDPASQRPSVTIWVAGDAGAAAGATQALAGTAMPGQGLKIHAATPIAMQLRLSFLCASTLEVPAIQAALASALTDPDTGLFSANTPGIGAVIYDSQIEAACLGVAGVQAVHDLQFSALEQALRFRSVQAFPRRLPVLRFAPPGCGGRRHDPGAGGYFVVASPILNPQIAVPA